MVNLYLKRHVQGEFYHVLAPPDEKTQVRAASSQCGRGTFRFRTDNIENLRPRFMANTDSPRTMWYININYPVIINMFCQKNN